MKRLQFILQCVLIFGGLYTAGIATAQLDWPWNLATGLSLGAIMGGWFWVFRDVTRILKIAVEAGEESIRALAELRESYRRLIDREIQREANRLARSGDPGDRSVR